ncbi:hypothetical protein Tco_1493404, partial [Tanacetum coccineum]
MTREAVNELIERRVAEALEARDATRNLEPLLKGRGEQEDRNGDDYEGGKGGGNKNGGVNEIGGNGNGGGNNNRNGNGNERGNGYNFGGLMPVARECTYQDFLKCQPLNFNGTEGVVGLTRWFEKIGFEAAYAMKWTELMKRFQELVLFCTRMVPDEEDKDAIRVANNLMDQKLKDYARNIENKRRFDNNPRDNRRQQPAFKQQNVGGQNVARACT